MRPLILLSGILAVAVTFAAPALAQNYPWCAQYGGRAGGATNCGFSTFEQCMATVSGIGGFCDRNTLYVPPHARPRVHRHKKHPPRHEPH
jgi:Protein of unknown function (DUF3551)